MSDGGYQSGFLMDDDDRVPPQDLEAEQAILGACIIGGTDNCTMAVEALLPAHFYRIAHGHIFTAIVSLWTAREPIDTVTLSSELRRVDKLETCGGLDYLDRLLRSTPYSTNIGGYIEIVLDRAARRDLAMAGRKVVAAAHEAESASQASAAAYELVTSAIGAHTPTAEAQITGGELLGLWMERTAVTGRPIPTGFPTLDDALHGGWRRKQVHVLTARTGIGKSGMACFWASAAIDAGYRVGFASLEMPEEELMARIIAQRTGISYRHCENGPRNIPSAVDREIALYETDKIAPYLVVDEANAYNVAEMRRRLMALRRHHGCDLIILDQFNNIAGSGKTDYERKQSVNDELQRLGHPQGLGVPLIVLAQQNRQGVDNPNPETIKGCGDIEELAPVVITLQSKYDENADPSKPVPYVLRTPKIRGGHRIKLQLLGDPDTFAFREAPPEQRDAANSTTPSRTGRRRADGDYLQTTDADPFGPAEN